MMIKDPTVNSASSSYLNSFSILEYEKIFEKKFFNSGKSIFKCDCYHIENIPKDILPFHSPKLAYLELTSKCNNDCYGCSVHLKGKKIVTSLLFEQWRIILNKLKRDIIHLHLTGGEPTLHQDFKKIIRYIENSCISFSIFSNGRWENTKDLLSCLTKVSQFSGFLISLHGCTAEQHDTFTNTKNSFNETINNIKHAIDKGHNVHLSTIITKKNYNKINEIVDFFIDLGIRYINFNRYIGPFIADISPATNEFKIAMNDIELLKAKGFNIQFGNCIPQCFQKSSSNGCLAGIAFCSIDSWGNVKPCNHAFLNCGNLIHQSIFEVWNSEPMNYWRNLFSEECKTCIEFSSCHGGCRAEALLSEKYGDPLIRIAA